MVAPLTYPFGNLAALVASVIPRVFWTSAISCNCLAVAVHRLRPVSDELSTSAHEVKAVRCRS